MTTEEQQFICVINTDSMNLFVSLRHELSVHIYGHVEEL